MRSRYDLLFFFALVSFLFPVAVFGQFQPPLSAELEMKSDPKAPGAAAVYLQREEIADDNLNYHSFYARIKVLTEKGKELATVSVPYEKGIFSVTDVKARTIHADGTIVPLDVKPSDLVEVKGKAYQINKMVFTLPSVEVGSVLEYKWQLRYDDDRVSSPNWDIQQPYYMHKAHYVFIPYRGMAEKVLYSSMLPSTAKVNMDVVGKYTLDIADVVASPDEEYMPPMGSFLVHVKFYYSSSHDKNDFWKSEGARWSKEMDHFANESKMLKEAVGAIVSPGDSEDVKAHKIYDAVMKLDNTDYTRRKSKEELKQMGLKQTKQAEDVWKQKSGSSDELALLYLAMVRIAGLKAYAATVCDRDREIFSEYYMSFQQFDDIMVIVSIGGKEIPVDPGKKFASFGELAWNHTYASGLRQGDKGTTFVTLPGNSYKEAVTLRVADITVEKDGSISGIARISMTGPEALKWRDFTLEKGEDEVKKEFVERLREIVPDGVSVEMDHFLAMDDYKSQLMGIVKLSGNMGTATGKRAFLPGVFFESRAKHPFVEVANRMTAVDMSYASTIKDDVTYHLPESFTTESFPPDASIPWTGHAVFVMKSTSTKGQIAVGRTLARGFTLVEPKEYGDLRNFYQKISTADQQQMVFTLSTTSASN